MFMSPPVGFEPATLGFLAGHLARLAIGTVDYLYFKLLQYSEVTGNVWVGSARKPRIAGSIPGGEMYFILNFRLFPFLTGRPCIFIAAV